MWSELPGHGFVLIKKKINHGCGGNNCCVAITVTKIQNLLPFHSCSGMKLPQMVFSFYMEVMSKEQAWCVTPWEVSQGRVTHFILRLQWPSTAVACFAVGLFRAILVTHSHPFREHKCTL